MWVSAERRKSGLVYYIETAEYDSNFANFVILFCRTSVPLHDATPARANPLA